MQRARWETKDFLPADKQMIRPRVLIADDDRALRSSVQRLLEPEFEVVAAVADGAALLEACQTVVPDVVVADISMPRLNGFQAARRLRETQAAVPIVFLTVHEEETVIAEALRIGVAAYVLKRSASADLVPAIRSALQGRCFVSPAVQQH